MLVLSPSKAIKPIAEAHAEVLPASVRLLISVPRHHPATVGRSCVDVMASAEMSHASGAENAWPFRSNQSTRIP